MLSLTSVSGALPRGALSTHCPGPLAMLCLLSQTKSGGDCWEARLEGWAATYFAGSPPWR